MKIPSIKVTAQSIRNRRGILAGLITILVFFNVLPKAWGADLFWAGNATTLPAAADSGTWTTNTFTGTPNSWSPSSTSFANSVWVQGSLAHFLGSGGGTVTLDTNITAAGINFDPGASAFTINTNGNTFSIQGAGIVNNSGQAQTITNNDRGNIETGFFDGFTDFINASTAGSATITNNGGQSGQRGFTNFQNTSTAGNATITNNGGLGSGGFTDFINASTAGSATIINNGGTANAVFSGRTEFHNASTAGNATITNNAAAAGAGGAAAGSTIFFNASNAGSATIANSGGAVSGASGGSTSFVDASSASSATIINNGGAVSGASGGLTQFEQLTSSAGSATIINNGGAVSGASGGLLLFLNASTAGSATITSNGGTGGGLGGRTEFDDNSDGGTARAITDGNGSFDISRLITTGMGIGSIAGSGNYFLGSKTLTVGGNNSSTTVSGVIQDGGLVPSAGGSLTKVGTGTLTLTGVNTYTGITTINAGVLTISQDANLGITPGTPVPNHLTFNGGTLQATATFTLNTNRGITLNAGAGIFDVTDANMLTYGGVITGPGSLTKVGTGTLTLLGSNTFSGVTTITAGTLQLGNGGTTGSITGDVANNGVLVFDRSNVLTFGGVISGAGSIQHNGTGTTVLVGDNSYSGGTTIGGGTLQLGNGGTLGSIVGDVTNNGVLAFNRSDIVTFPGVISGTGMVNQVGSGTTVLTGTNSYGGVTTVAAGSLFVNGDQSAATGATNVAGGATLGGTGTIGGSVSIADGGTLAPGGVGGGIGTLTINGSLGLNSGSTLNYSFGQAGVVGGPFNDLAVVKGNLTLAGTLNVALTPGGAFGPGIYRVMSYAGTLTDNGLALGSVPPGTTEVVQTSVPHEVNLVNTTGLTLNYWDGAAAANKNNGVVDGGNGTWQNSAGNDNWTNGAGALNAPWANAAFAIFEAAPGTVAVDNSLGQVVASGMQFAVSGYTVSGEPITLVETEAGSGATVVRVGDGTAAGTGMTAIIASVLQGSTRLVKDDLGTLVLSGANTYTGGTAINGGTLQVANDTNLGATAGGLSFDGGTLATTDTFTSARMTTLNAGGGTFDVAPTTTLTLSGAIGGTGALTKADAGTLVLTGTNSYSGGTTIGGGTLQLGNGGTLGSIVGDVTNNGVLAFNRSDIVTFPGVISGTGSVIQAGTGTTILTGTNSYTGGTTITAGTLQLGDGGATGSILGNVANNGVLVFDRSNVLTFGGVISGAGSVAQIGTGTTILAGNNTYTGGTTVSAGTLQAGSANGFSHNSEFTVNSTLDLNGFNNTIGSLSGAGTVLNNGPAAAALTVGGDNDNSIFAGVLQNGTSSLQLTKSGTDTLILTGTNLYTGGTTISIGMLQLGNGGTAGSVIGDVLDNGTLAFNRSNSVTFGGVIRGTGNVVNMGPGTLILTGANTYTGGTAINTGTLQLGNGGTTGSIAGNVIDNGTLAFNRSDSVTFAGVISGTGNVVKLGSGTLTLPGANTYTGSTTINNGSLIVNGSLASTQTVINPGGSLGGHGTVGGNLINNGIVSQASSPGTLTVANNFTQNASGTLRIGVAGVALGQHDLLAVNGHAALAGTLQLFPLTGFNLQPGDQITFLTAKNGVSGSFANAQNGLVSTGTILEVQVRSLANSVVLETVQGSFASTPEVAPTQNTQAVAKALDSAAGDPREAALFAFLNSQPLANLPHDLELIAPAQITSLNATAVSVSNVQTSNIGQRLANVHAGSTGFSSAGFSITGSAASFGEGFAGPTGSEGKSAPPVFAPTPNNRWGVFVTGLGEFTNVDSTPNAAGYNVDTGGFTLGVDYRLTPNFAIGLTVGYAHTSVHPDGGGNIDVNGGKIGAYATFFGNGFYLDTAVSGGPNGYNTHRTALQGAANGSTDGADFDFLVATGYDWQKGNLTIGPTASFQYNYVGLQSFTETGSLAPLTFPDQNTQSERTAFGAKVSYEWKVGNVTVLPQVSTAWQHEFGATAYSVIASFASGAGNSFSVFGPNIGRDSLLVGAGATVILNERLSTYLYYDGEFARTNYLSNNVSTGVRISF
jgi:fibronectin-binding autotransporter adhesin